MANYLRAMGLSSSKLLAYVGFVYRKLDNRWLKHSRSIKLMKVMLMFYTFCFSKLKINLNIISYDLYL